MRSESRGRSGRQPMTDKRLEYVRLIRIGVSNSEACRRLGIDRKTGHWWKNGGSVTRNGITRVVEPIIDHHHVPVESGRYLAESERVTIADGVREGRSARSIAAELGRAVSTVSRELQRNASADGGYRPHAAHALMRSRRPRPKQRLLERDEELRRLVQHYLDRRWSPEQVVHELRAAHGRHLAVETIYQALYSPYRVIERQATNVLRTGRPCRRSRVRGDQRRPRFVVPITMIEERAPEANDRSVPGHWEDDLIVGAYNRSAIGTLVERVTRFTILVHLAGESRSDTLRTRLEAIVNELPLGLRKSLTWDQGSEMCHHHSITAATQMPVFFCHKGRTWQRPSNEHTNGLLRNYFPKGTDLSVHSTDDLARVSDELNRRPRKTMGWQTPKALFTTLRNEFA
jgi:transposase, IS30 family